MKSITFMKLRKLLDMGLRKRLVGGWFLGLGLLVPGGARAQFYEIANQLPGLLQPALSGSMNYRGIVEADVLPGIGNNRATFVGVSTSQGFQYSNWFFMGVGIGVDVAMSNAADNPDSAPGSYRSYTTKAMVPVFTDFRFNIGGNSAPSFYIDVKLGATWMLGSGYLRFVDGYLSHTGQFYCKPSVGIRIPTSKKNPKQAFNIGVTYQLITSNNNYAWGYRNGSVTLNNVGATLGFEW